MIEFVAIHKPTVRILGVSVFSNAFRCPSGQQVTVKDIYHTRKRTSTGVHRSSEHRTYKHSKNKSPRNAAGRPYKGFHTGYFFVSRSRISAALSFARRNSSRRAYRAETSAFRRRMSASSASSAWSVGSALALRCERVDRVTVTGAVCGTPLGASPTLGRRMGGSFLIAVPGTELEMGIAGMGEAEP